MRFEGAYTALVTPMLPDRMIDYEGLKKNVEFQISQGITGVVPTGTTGESPTLSWKEHNLIIERALDVTAGRVDVIAGTGSNSTEECIASTRHAADAGAGDVLMVDCYYNGPSSQELRDEYYSTVARLFPQISIVPYIIPGRSGTALAPEDLAILSAEHPNISAVKEATGDLRRMALTRELCGQDFAILSGDDDLTYQMLVDPAIAANGVISVTSNIAPGATQKMVAAARSGDKAGAEAMQKALAPLFSIVTVKVENERTLPDGRRVKVVDKYRNPLAIKTLMNALGMPCGPCRSPLGCMTEAGVDVVRQAAKTVWENNPEILEPIAEFYDVDVAARIAEDRYWK
ncbi:MAG: 4-hydroxy-tetrahydrodipicolinate synthase [Armatimonadetes bacterium]|nr:4-hydroxy-tetrahydrodipicolinate synthase [Armatimonadota bacterium]